MSIKHLLVCDGCGAETEAREGPNGYRPTNSGVYWKCYGTVDVCSAECLVVYAKRLVVSGEMAKRALVPCW